MKAFGILGIVILVCIAGFICRTKWAWWRFDHLEQTARKAITASELQAWATKVIEESRNYSVQQHNQLRTNYPPKLRGLAAGLEPDVSVLEAKYSTDGQDEVWLIW